MRLRPDQIARWERAAQRAWPTAIQIDGVAWETLPRGQGGVILDNETYIIADVRKLDDAWVNLRIEPGGEGGIGRRYDDFGWFLSSVDVPIKMPEIGLNDDGRSIGFTNGRHRFAWLRDHGRQRVPVVVAQKDAKRLQELIGAKATKANRREDAKDLKLYDQAVRKAKRKFTWPSIPASAWVQDEYKRLYAKKHGARKKPYRGKRPGKDEGLRKWFDEQWVDISRPKKGGGFEPCMRDEVERGYPKCLPKAKAEKMTKAERERAVRRKRRAQRKAGRPTGKRKGKAIMVETNPMISGGYGPHNAMVRARTEGAGMVRTERGDNARMNAQFWLEQADIALGEELGCGAFGCALVLAEHPDWIVKITTDQTDAAAHALILQDPELRAMPGIPDVRAVFEVYPGVYAIVRPILYPLDDTEGRKYGLTEVDHAARLGQFMWETDLAPAELRKEVESIRALYPEFADRAETFGRSLDAMAQRKIYPTDLGGYGNVMRDRDGNWVAADLGIAVAPEVFIPTLDEWVDRRSGREVMAQALGEPLGEIVETTVANRRDGPDQYQALKRKLMRG